MPMAMPQIDDHPDNALAGALIGGAVSEHDPVVGPFEEETGPTRRCIITGEHGSPEVMVRFVVGPDEAVHPDFDGKLPGRGMWLRADSDALRSAVKKRAFSRAARQQINVGDDLEHRVFVGLQKRCLDAISLARRAGQIVSGYDRVIEALGAEPSRWVAVLEAIDATPNAVSKMRGPAADRPVLRIADGALLGGVLGRDRCVHACVSKGGLATRLMRDARRLDGFLSAPSVRLYE